MKKVTFIFLLMFASYANAENYDIPSLELFDAPTYTPSLIDTSDLFIDRHRVYLGVGWKHFSNVDAGVPFNDHHEDNVDHFGVDVEYQYHFDKRSYFAASLGVGWTKANTKHQRGWDCSGCKLPSSMTLEYKYRIF